MSVKGIRGAITVEENTASAIKDAVTELLNEMVERMVFFLKIFRMQFLP